MSNYVATGYVATGFIGDSNSFGGVLFDPVTRRIILSTTSISATELYSRSYDWLAYSDNAKYGAVFRQVGSDDLGSGLSIPPYFFLQNSWRIRPMEANHNLIITGNIFVDGGGVPVVSTLGTFQVIVQYTVPVQAQGIATSGPSASEISSELIAAMITAGIGSTTTQIKNAVWSEPLNNLNDKNTIGGYISRVLLSIPKFLGLK